MEKLKIVILSFDPKNFEKILVESKNKILPECSTSSGKIQEDLINFSKSLSLDYTSLKEVKKIKYEDWEYLIYIDSDKKDYRKEDSLTYIEVKELTHKDNSRSQLYLKVILTLFEDLNFIKFIK